MCWWSPGALKDRLVCVLMNVWCVFWWTSGVCSDERLVCVLKDRLVCVLMNVWCVFWWTSGVCSDERLVCVLKDRLVCVLMNVCSQLLFKSVDTPPSSRTLTVQKSGFCYWTGNIPRKSNHNESWASESDQTVNHKKLLIQTKAMAMNIFLLPESNYKSVQQEYNPSKSQIIVVVV